MSSGSFQLGVAAFLAVLAIGCTVPHESDDADPSPKKAKKSQPVEDGTCELATDCDEGSFCAYPVGVCGGEGVCAPIEPTEVCGPVPVCGCDGITYPSACDASRVGVSLVHEGACAPPVPPPMGSALCGGSLCADGQFCEVSDGTCGASGTLGGLCVAQFGVCTAPKQPTCGCDGQTYESVCALRQAGVSMLHVGACGSV